MFAIQVELLVELFQEHRHGRKSWGGVEHDLFDQSISRIHVEVLVQVFQDIHLDGCGRWTNSKKWSPRDRPHTQNLYKVYTNDGFCWKLCKPYKTCSNVMIMAVFTNDDVTICSTAGSVRRTWSSIDQDASELIFRRPTPNFLCRYSEANTKMTSIES